MTPDLWVKEVRRLVMALSTDEARFHAGTQAVSLSHVVEINPKTKEQRPVWIASCWGCSRIEGETSDGAMRALLADLHGRLAERIAKQKSDLERLEKSAACTLRAVTS